MPPLTQASDAANKTYMPISLPPSHWTPGAATAAATPWRPWLTSLESDAAGTGGASARRWEMKRNCSITPNQLLAVYLGLCAVSLAIGVFFLMQGAAMVLGFAGLELALVGAAMLVFARHAGDRESVSLHGRRVQVEQLDAGVLSRNEFRAEWLRVEPAAGQGSLVEISGQGRSIKLGRFVRPELRAELASEMRQALRRACLCEPPERHASDRPTTR